MNRLLSGLPAVLCLLLPNCAEAFINPPEILPLRPLVSSAISMRIRSGECDVFLTTGPQDRELEVSGNRVVVRLNGHSTEDPAQCIFQDSTKTYAIGELPAGRYDLEVFQRDVFITTQLTLVGSASFEVSVGNSFPIPAVGWPALIALGAVISGLSLLRLRTRNPAA